ncbi:MAG TPA: lysophospholipid acyltransferase family protein [Candidatus Dormibacteraeota bacterium]
MPSVRAPGSVQDPGATVPVTAAAPLPGVRLDGTESGLLILTRAVLRLTVGAVALGGVQLDGLDRVPREGPLLICSNHVSNFDPLVYAALLPRVLHALTKAELYDNPLLRTFLLHCNCIPVHRGTPDRRAIRSALTVLGSGGALLLFPEGHRAKGTGMLGFAAGAGYLAARSGARVLPCAIWGTERVLPPGRLLPRRKPISVRLGASFQPVSTDPTETSREIQDRVAELLPEGYRSSADPG